MRAQTGRGQLGGQAARTLVQVIILSGANGSGFHSPQVGTPDKGTALHESGPKQPTTVMYREQLSATNSA